MDLGKFKPSTQNQLKDSLGTLNTFGYGKIDHLPKHIPTGSQISVAFPTDPNTGTTLLRWPGHLPRWSNDQDLLVRLHLLADDAATWGNGFAGMSPNVFGRKMEGQPAGLPLLSRIFSCVLRIGGSCLKCFLDGYVKQVRLPQKTMQSRKINEQIMWQTKHQF